MTVCSDNVAGADLEPVSPAGQQPTVALVVLVLRLGLKRWWCRILAALTASTALGHAWLLWELGQHDESDLLADCIGLTARATQWSLFLVVALGGWILCRGLLESRARDALAVLARRRARAQILLDRAELLAAVAWLAALQGLSVAATAGVGLALVSGGAAALHIAQASGLAIVLSGAAAAFTAWIAMALARNRPKGARLIWVAMLLIPEATHWLTPQVPTLRVLIGQVGALVSAAGGIA